MSEKPTDSHPWVLSPYTLPTSLPRFRQNCFNFRTEIGKSSVAVSRENSFMMIHSWFQGLSTAQEKRKLNSSSRICRRKPGKVTSSHPKTTIPVVEALEDRLAPALFQAPIVTGTGGLNPPASAQTDFSADGLFDVAAVNNRANNPTLSVLFGKGNRTFTQWPLFA